MKKWTVNPSINDPGHCVPLTPKHPIIIVLIVKPWMQRCTKWLVQAFVLGMLFFSCRDCLTDEFPGGQVVCGGLCPSVYQENHLSRASYHAVDMRALTLTLPGPSAGLSGSLDSYCSLKPLCSGMGEVVPARTSPTLLPPSPRTVLSLSCFKVSQCINCRDWHFKR